MDTWFPVGGAVWAFGSVPSLAGRTMSLGLEFRSLRLQPTSSLLSLFWLAFEDGHSQHPAPDCCCLSCLYSAITDSYFSGAFSHKQTNKNFCNFPWSWGVITEQKSSYYIFILIYLFICLFIIVCSYDTVERGMVCV